MHDSQTIYTRFNADQTRRIDVFKQSIDDAAYCDARWLGVEVLTSNLKVADVFLVDPVSSGQDGRDCLARRSVQAAVNDDIVLYMCLSTDDSNRFIVTTFDAYLKRYDWQCIGIMVFSRDAWRNAKPRVAFTEKNVLETARDLFEERVTRVLNNESYRATVSDTGFDHLTVTDVFDGFCSAEDALYAAMNDYPDVQWMPCTATVQ